MAGESLFKDLEIQAFRAGITPRTKESIRWFQDKARQMFRGRFTMNRRKIMQDDALDLRNKPITRTGPQGNMYMFFYDPKHKETLPYYDGFPLIIMMGPAKGGFMGLNLHYLPPALRARLLDTVLGGNAAIPQKYIEPAMKHYLFKHVRSKFALVDKPEWEIATFLPSADWNKASASTVYRDSRKKLRA
jgi:hypothetical protein|tara:strand:+ start:730 stop:1296 length:567 start_codon:yes stop_codon:yes gene_type:complete